MAFLEVSKLYKSFGKTDVLKGISFGLEEGEALSIIGSSGNGKTTLLRCLNGLENADSGSITVDGKTVFPKGEGEKGDDELPFGLVFQSFNLFPQYTAFDNIKLPLTLAEKKRKKRGEAPLYTEDIDSVVLSLLREVGLESKKDLHPCELSGGQCQRVAIARAMALKPKILCFDEPTSALDPELTGEVLRVIRSLKESSGMTMIIVTHEMAFAKSVSDKVLFMADGKALAFGSPEEIFDRSEDETVRSFLKNRF